MRVTANDKPWLRDEFGKVWRKRDGSIDGKMVDCCVKKKSAFMVFDDATVVTFDKPNIRTHFCFGYGVQGAYDYDEAGHMADVAASSEAYFINANMDGTKAARWMKYIQDDLFPFEPWLDRRRYINQYDDCKLGEIRWEHWHNRDWCERQGWRRLTEDELHELYAILFDEQMRFCKRLKTYLKRYGTSKVRTWTYWADE